MVVCCHTYRQGSVVPCRFRHRRDEGHRALRQRGDGQAWVDAEIRSQYRSIADVQIAVAKDAVVRVNDAKLG